jgi:hypothetical protein
MPFNLNDEKLAELEKCQVNNDKITVFLTAIYMMLANVIMLNILIAIFNFRYEEVQSNAKKISAYMRFLGEYKFLVNKMFRRQNF